MKHNATGIRRVMLGLLLSSGTSWAASAPMIEEVLVTATKRSTSLQDTAAAISAIGTDTLGFREINDINDLRTQVPNMNYSEVSGSPLISIRGIGQSLETGVGDPAVASHIDGVYLPRPGETSLGAIDLEQIEVLRGPQGTLYGRNATGGVINSVQASPSPEFSAGINAASASYGRRRLGAYVNGAIFDSLSGRIAYSEHDYDSEYKNIEQNEKVGDSTTTNARIALRYDFDNSASATLSVFKQQYNGTGPLYTVLNDPVDLTGQPIPPENYTNQRDRTRSEIIPDTDRRTEGGVMTLLIPIWSMDFKAVSGYLDHHHLQNYGPDETSQYIFDTQRLEYSRSLSQEFNLSGDAFDAKLQWLVGLYYFFDDAETSLPTFANVGVTTVPLLGEVSAEAFLTQYYDEENTAFAGFVDATWSFTDALRLNIGARSGEEVKKVEQTYSAVVLSPGGDVAVDPGCTEQDYEKKATSVDPKVAIQWDATDNIMTYLQYQTAFKSGGFNISSCNDQYEPEEIAAYEGGIKSNWLEDRLSLNLTVFDYAYDNFQVFQINGLSADIDNAASVTSRGAELELQFLFDARFSLDLNASWLEAEFDEYSDRDGFKNTAQFFEDSNAPLEDLSGNALVRTPHYSYTLGINYQHQLDRYGIETFRLRLETYATDEFYFRAFNTPEDRQEAYQLFNMYASASFLQQRLKLRVFAKNITDEEYYSAIFPIPNIKLYNGNFGEARAFGVALNFDY